MAKNTKRNLLEKIIAVQQEYQQHKGLDIPDTVIHRKYIKPKYFISLRTLSRYLERRAQHELDELNKKQAQQQEAVRYSQQNLFND